MHIITQVKAFKYLLITLRDLPSILSSFEIQASISKPCVSKKSSRPSRVAFLKKTFADSRLDELGERMKPRYITDRFPKFLEKHGFKHMPFHDLRHCSASLLLANGVQMKQIQEWLGHSDFSTTANIYAHLDYSSKISSAEAMTNILELPDDSCFESKWKNC